MPRKLTPEEIAARTEKRCSDCDEMLPIKEFIINKGRRGDGRRSVCKKCSVVRSKKWAQANSERFALLQKAYAKLNREKIVERGRRWREANRERYNAQQREYYHSVKKHKQVSSGIDPI